MTVLAAGWENMGGRTLREPSSGNTISYPLTGPLGQPPDPAHDTGLYTVAAWRNTDVEDFPSNIGDAGTDAFGNTLEEAFAGVPVPPV